MAAPDTVLPRKTRPQMDLRSLCREISNFAQAGRGYAPGGRLVSSALRSVDEVEFVLLAAALGRPVCPVREGPNTPNRRCVLNEGHGKNHSFEYPASAALAALRAESWDR